MTKWSRSHYIPDLDAHWRELGWLVRIVRTFGGEIEDAEAVLDHAAAACKYPEIVAWVQGCLGWYPHPDDWFPERPTPFPTWAAAARLLVHADLADEAEPLPGDPDVGHVLTRASLRWQIHLAQEAARHSSLRRALADDDLARLAERGTRMTQIGRPAGAALQQAVAALAEVR